VIVCDGRSPFETTILDDEVDELLTIVLDDLSLKKGIRIKSVRDCKTYLFINFSIIVQDTGQPAPDQGHTQTLTRNGSYPSLHGYGLIPG